MRSKLQFVIIILCFISCKNESESSNHIKVNTTLNRPVKNTTAALNSDQQSFTAPLEVFNNWLKAGITEKLIITKLGAGHTILSGEYSEVNGYYQEKWEYPEHGVTLLMQSEEPDSDKTVSEITITEPFGLKTSKGIGIGSSKNEIYKYYPTANQNDVDDDIIVVGDIYYGLFFTIRDNKVSKIFIGALAE